MSEQSPEEQSGRVWENSLYLALTAVLMAANARSYDLGAAGAQARVALERARPGSIERLDRLMLGRNGQG